MSPVRKILPRVRHQTTERELFSLRLLTQNGGDQTGRMKAFLVRELLSLTMAGNRELARVLQAFRKKLCLNGVLPGELYDQWLSRNIHSQGLPDHITDQGKRSRLRKSLVGGKDAVEHIVLRLYAADVLKPQSKGKPRHQLLTLAYHLQRQWLHVQLMDISHSYLEWDKEKKRKGHARMLILRQWQELTQSIRERAEAEGSDPDTAFFIHLPQGCGIHDLLTIPGVTAVEDMPTIPDETIEITYRIKSSKRDLPKQVSLASVISKPTKDDLLGDVMMAELPELKGLTHQEKDKLIDTLWEKIKVLRQHITAHLTGKLPA